MKADPLAGNAKSDADHGIREAQQWLPPGIMGI
jgi:hypothetical protein